MSDIFNKCRKKIIIEGLIKSCMVVAAIGCFAASTVLLVFWLTGIRWLWLTAVVGTGVWLIGIPILFLLFFKPTDTAIARRLDSLGLDARVSTMLELRNDKSYIAAKQREDTYRVLSKINIKQLKFVISKVLIVVLLISLFTTGSAATLVALTDNNIIPSPPDIVDNIVNPEQYYTIKYIAQVYGDVIFGGDSYVGRMIEGADEQLVAFGEAVEPVFALADPDWAFVCWSDGSPEPYREENILAIDDTIFDSAIVVEDDEGNLVQMVIDFDNGWEITKDNDGHITVTVYGYFCRIGDGEGDHGNPSDDMGEGGQEADAPTNGNPEGEGKDGDGDAKVDPGNKGDGTGSSGSERDNNKIIDGETDYKSRLEEYQALAESYRQRGESVPQDILDLISQYYDLLS